jgi:hypothetical protein
MPKTIEAYNDVVFMCHPWEDLQSSLPPMDTAIEGNIISALLMDINNNFKWDLDEKPDMSRTLSSSNGKSSIVEERLYSFFFAFFPPKKRSFVVSFFLF